MPNSVLLKLGNFYARTCSCRIKDNHREGGGAKPCRSKLSILFDTC